jgi:hypothetical protein
MGAEDFSSCCRSSPAPTCASARARRQRQCLHNSRYDFNDDILPLGAALHASLIEQAMPLPGGADAPFSVIQRLHPSRRTDEIQKVLRCAALAGATW